MYAHIERRTRNDARIAETGQQGQKEFFPAMKKAKGFVAFYVVAEADGNSAISIWQSKEDADAFTNQAVTKSWLNTLSSHGHEHKSTSGGEVRQHFTAEK